MMEQWPNKIIIPGVVLSLATVATDINPNVQILLLLTFIRALYNRIAAVPPPQDQMTWIVVHTVLCVAMCFSSYRECQQIYESNAQSTVQVLISGIAAVVAVLFMLGSWRSTGVPWLGIALILMGPLAALYMYIFDLEFPV